jgi:hypothetical protein
MKNLILIGFFISMMVFQLQGQAYENRYQEAIFSGADISLNVQFSSGVPEAQPGGGFYEFITGYPLNVDEFDTEPVNLFMDIYEPTGDTLSKRPVIILGFGGGFVAGDRKHFSMVLLANQLAELGFVVASMDYRLGMNIFDADLATRAVYRGIQDGRSAVRFFKANATTYGIDTSQIFMGGHSSGAFNAIHNIYLDKESERPLSTYNWTQDGNPVPDQGCLDCVGDNQGFDGEAKSIFSLAGAIGFTTYIEADDEETLMFHSTDDGTVPYDTGEPFSDISILVIGSDLPTVYGSLPMSQQMDIVGLDYEFYSYNNRGHGVHENGSQLYTDIIPGISDWFYEQQLKPALHSITGAELVCKIDPQQVYNVDANLAEYYDWQVEGGTFVGLDPFSNEATVLWDTAATTHTISATPYSCQGARGDTVSITIQLLDRATNNFIVDIANLYWNDDANWSLGHIPLICEDVVMAYPTATIAVTMDGAAKEEIFSLYLGPTVNLIINNPIGLNIKGGGNAIIDGQLDVAGALIISNCEDANLSNIVVNGTLGVTGYMSLKEPGIHNVHLVNGGDFIVAFGGNVDIESFDTNPNHYSLLIEGTMFNSGSTINITGLNNENEVFISNTGRVTNANHGLINIGQ